MVAINQFLLLGLLQALLVLGVLLAIWIWRLRRTDLRLRSAQTQIKQLQARATAVEYLQSEAERVQKSLSEDETERRWQELRGAYLAFELQRAQTTKPDAVDMSALRERLEPLLTDGAVTPAPPSSDDVVAEIDAENIDFPEMLRRHKQLLDALKTQIHGAVTNIADLQRCDEKFGLLDLVGREMESCTMMVEEENSFLRDQVRALLEHPDSS